MRLSCILNKTTLLFLKLEHIMFYLIKDDFFEGVYQDNIYCRLQFAEVEGVKSFFTICYSIENLFISSNPTNLDILEFKNLKNTYIGRKVQQLKKEGYIYLNEEYMSLLKEVEHLKETFLEKNGSLEGEELKFAWRNYKLQNLDDYSIYILDKLSHIRKSTESINLVDLNEAREIFIKTIDKYFEYFE